jgi:hypothetical protein
VAQVAGQHAKSINANQTLRDMHILRRFVDTAATRVKSADIGEFIAANLEM